MDAQDTMAVVFTSGGEREEDRRIFVVSDHGVKSGTGLFGTIQKEEPVGMFSQAQVKMRSDQTRQPCRTFVFLASQRAEGRRAETGSHNLTSRTHSAI